VFSQLGQRASGGTGLNKSGVCASVSQSVIGQAVEGSLGAQTTKEVTIPRQRGDAAQQDHTERAERVEETSSWRNRGQFLTKIKRIRLRMRFFIPWESL
jgi:hypothetical protein